MDIIDLIITLIYVFVAYGATVLVLNAVLGRRDK